MQGTYVCDGYPRLHGLEPFLRVQFVDELVGEENRSIRRLVVLVRLKINHNRLKFDLQLAKAAHYELSWNLKMLRGVSHKKRDI